MNSLPCYNCFKTCLLKTNNFLKNFFLDKKHRQLVHERCLKKKKKTHFNSKILEKKIG